MITDDAGGASAASADSDTAMTEGVCDVDNRVSNPFFDEWNSDTAPAAWTVSAGAAELVSHDQAETALRISPEDGPAGSTWVMGQVLSGVFEPGVTYFVEFGYRKVGGQDVGTEIHVEFDAGGFASANVSVAASEQWQQGYAELVLPDDEGAETQNTIPLLIASFDNDQVIEFDSIVVSAEACP